MPKKPREIVRTYLGVGSNLGNREAHIREAIAELALLGDIVAVSNIYETAPVGPPQPDYLNCCVGLDTGLSATGLHGGLVAIECSHGRTRAEHWGARTLDLDLLLYGPLELHSETLTLPHKEMHRRGFVLAPLQEIAPNVIVPVQGKSVAALWAEWILADGNGIRRYSGAGATD